jgi:RNA polymerase sigma-70 factor (ECF subfamily)
VLRSRTRPPGRAEKSWLYTIALNCLRDGARRRNVEQQAFERLAVEHGGWGGDPGGALEAVARRQEIQDALGALGDEEREALALRFGADLSVPEIARTLRVPLTTAEGRVYRGLRKLRDALG